MCVVSMAAAVGAPHTGVTVAATATTVAAVARIT
jgi:hypothetical protein